MTTKAATIFRYAMLMLAGAVFAFPVFWMLTTSVKTEAESQKTILPSTVRIANYTDAMAFEHGKPMPAREGEPAWLFALRTPFARQLVNTLIVGVLGTIGVLFAGSLAAYAFARLEWPGRDFFFTLTVSTMMVPFAVKLVPIYGMFRAIGWIDTLKPIWAGWFFGSGFTIFLLRQFFKGIPKQLTEAARIDGCSEFGIYWRIVLPLAKPALAAAGVFHFLYMWNDFFAPLVFLTQPEHFTLALGLHQFQATHGGGTPWTLMMAAASLMTAPVIALFFLTQTFFVRGVTMTGIKG